MRKPNLSIPSYRHHKPSGRAVVTLNGKDHYLGPWNSDSSKAEYNRLLAEWLAAKKTSTLPYEGATWVTVAELLVAYLSEAEVTHRKNGQPTSHLHNIKDAVVPLSEMYPEESVSTFSPLKLKAVREVLIQRRLCRSTINKRIGIIKRIFKWGTVNELVPASVFHALIAVSGLRRGRSLAKESVQVKPVPESHVEAAIRYLSPQVAAMIRLQQITGMRSGEVIGMRGCDIDTASKVWVYTPASHKTEHHGHERPIYLGPKAQEIVRPLLKADVKAHLFDPRDVVEEFNAKKRENRATPMTPSQSQRLRKRNPKRAPKEHYTNESYRRAIARACRKADAAARKQHPNAKPDEALVPAWHPHQLRHNAATRLRKEFGIEAARVVLGHRSSAVTELYAELDATKASTIMEQVG